MTPEAMRVLVDELEAFLRVPKVTYDEWMGLDEDVKAAMIQATKRIEIERALLIATALKGELGAAIVAKELDGGEAWVRGNVRMAIDQYVARFSKR